MTKTEQFLLRIGARADGPGIRRLADVIDKMRANGDYGDNWERNCLEPIAKRDGINVQSVLRSIVTEIKYIYTVRINLPPELTADELTGRLPPKRFCATVAMMTENEI